MSAISISEVCGFTVVYLKLNMESVPTKTMVAHINGACDQVGDTGSSTVLHIQICAAPASSPSVTDSTTTPTVNQWERALRRLERLNACTMTSVSGDCTWLGLALMLASDYRMASNASRFALSGAAAGIMPGMVIHRLANQLGAARVRKLVLFGAELSAEEAKRLDLIDETSADIGHAVIERIGRLHPGNMSDWAIRRNLLLEASSQDYDAALGVHLAACDRYIRQQGRRAGTDESGGSDVAAAAILSI